jgi:hypothetical protein
MAAHSFGSGPQRWLFSLHIHQPKMPVNVQTAMQHM